MVMQVLDAIDSFLYYPVLLIVMGAAGLYFSVRMGFVQVRMLSEAIRVMKAKPADNSGTSPFQALMISTASCVGPVTSSVSHRQFVSAARALHSG